MGSPCPPCKRLRRANLELLPHVNNLLGSFLGWGGEVREELMSHSARAHSYFEGSHISFDGKQQWGLHPQECKQHCVPDLCDLPQHFDC